MSIKKSGRLSTQRLKQAKKVAGRSAAYLRDIAYRLGGVAKAFNVEVRQLSPQDVADYLGKLKLQPRDSIITA
jgi:hypothetical protein